MDQLVPSHIKATIFTLILFFVAVIVAAANHHAPKPVVQVRYASLAGMAQVAVITRNISYCNTTNPAQQLDLYLPKSTSPKPFPLVAFVHGGGWQQGSKNDPLVTKYGISIVSHGMALASIGYRLAPASTFPAQDNDVNCALTYLYDNAAKYRLDNTRLALFGDSAGGQLVAYASLATADQTAPWHASLRGVVDMYGVSDLTDLPPGTHIAHVAQQFLGPNGQNLAQLASPVYYAPAHAAPMLLFHGTQDHNVPIAQSIELQNHLHGLGFQSTLVTVINGGHGFSGLTNPTVPQITTRTTDFLGGVLGIKIRQVS